MYRVNGKIIIFLLLVFFGGNLSSCIDCCEEHLGPNEVKKENCPIFGPGIHPVQIGDIKFEYNFDYSIAELGRNLCATVEYEPFEIARFYEYPSVDASLTSGYEETKISNVLFNEKGKIEFFSAVQQVEVVNSIESEEQRNIHLNCSLEYDLSGERLININGELIAEKYIDGVQSVSSNATFSIDLNWVNSNLHKVTATYHQQDGFVEKTIYTFEYGSKSNNLQQYVSSIFEQGLAEVIFCGEDIGGLINLKLLGNPSTDFISKVSISETEIDEMGTYTYDYNYNYSYTFNDDDTLKSYTQTDDDGYSTTWDCIFTDDYSITPNRNQDSRTYDGCYLKSARKTGLFKKSNVK